MGPGDSLHPDPGSHTFRGPTRTQRAHVRAGRAPVRLLHLRDALLRQHRLRPRRGGLCRPAARGRSGGGPAPGAGAGVRRRNHHSTWPAVPPGSPQPWPLPPRTADGTRWRSPSGWGCRRFRRRRQLRAPGGGFRRRRFHTTIPGVSGCRGIPPSPATRPRRSGRRRRCWCPERPAVAAGRNSAGSCLIASRVALLGERLQPDADRVALHGGPFRPAGSCTRLSRARFAVAALSGGAQHALERGARRRSS